MFRFDPNDTDPAIRSADRRIQREALRQLDSIDLDDDDARIDPLPRTEADSMLAVDEIVGQTGD